MATTMTETDDGLFEETNRKTPTVSLPHGQFTTVELHPTVGDSEYGTRKREWGASQTEGVELADVTGFEIVEYDFESDDDFDSYNTGADSEFEFYEAEFREWVEATLFDENGPTPDQDVIVRYLGDEKFELKNEWEPETLVVALELTNVRRI